MENLGFNSIGIFLAFAATAIYNGWDLPVMTKQKVVATDVSLGADRKVIKDFTIQSGKWGAKFSLDTELKNQKFLVVRVDSIGPHVRSTNGAGSVLTVVTNDGLKNYRDQFEGRRYCAGSFMNRHTRRVRLYSANELVAKKLKRWERREYRRVSTWEHARISGWCINDRLHFSENGEELDLAPWITPGLMTEMKAHPDYENCSAIFVEALEVENAKLADKS